MAFNSPQEVLGAIAHAYYQERNIEAVLCCVTDDVEWVGTEAHDRVTGKSELKKLLQSDFAAFPVGFAVDLDNPTIQPIGSDGAVITVSGTPHPAPGTIVSNSIRGTLCCVKTEHGWLVSNGHTSVPSAEIEKISLQNALEEEREKQKALLDNVPGGVCMYRIKKDGRITADYVSDGLARICGYDDSEDIMKILRDDSRKLVYPEDYPAVAATCREAWKKGLPAGAHYRVCSKDGTLVNVTLDAVSMKNAKLGDDDVGVFYAVQTLVSEEVNRKEKEQKTLLSLLNTVPAGIGIFDVNEEGVCQVYLNDAFYRLIDTKREDRTQYFGRNTLASTHPDDVKKTTQAIEQLLAGEDSVQLDYRVKGGKGKWYWLHVAAVVVDRNDKGLRMYIAYNECTESKQQQIRLLQDQKAVSLAEQQGKLSIWTYNIDRNVIIQPIMADTLGHMGYPCYIANVPECFLEMDSIYPDDIEKYKAAYDGLENGEERVDVIYRLVDQYSGEYNWVHMYYRRMENNEENERMAVGFSVQVNVQQEAIEKYQTEHKLREQMYASAAIYMEYNLTTGHYVAGNKLSEQYSTGCWDRPTIEEFRESLSTIVDERYLDELIDKMYAGNLLKAFENGETQTSVEYRIKARPGVPAQWYRVTATMIKRPDTNEVMAFVYVEDIEEAKDCQLAIEGSVSDGIESVAVIRLEDGQARIIFEHGLRVAKEAEKCFCYDDAFVERSSKATIPEEREFSYTAALLSTLRAEIGKQNVYQYAITTQFGSTATKRQLFRFRYLDDRKTHVVMSISDITSVYLEDMEKKRKLEDALCEARRASRAKADFFSRVSHDMRTPMNGILGLATLSEDEADIMVLKDNLTKIEESGKYLLGIINDTLDIQRIESGKLTLNPEVVDCRRTIGTAIEMVRPAIAAKNIDFRIVNKGVDMDCNVRIDPVRMKQIFVNLISNAIKFTPEGGRIDFEFECIGRDGPIVHDRFTVRDNGVGMSESFLRDKIFKSYAQEQNSYSNQYAGTGLGLSIVKRLVELMGGTIKVESKLGEGSAFIINLDIERVDEPVEKNVAADEAEQNAVKNLDGCKILLAEDHPLNAEIAEKLLEKVGCTVTWVKDGQACLDTMKKFTPGQFDAILMDLRMPVMDGLTAATEIRKLEDEAARSIPVIAMTANAYSDDIEHCLAAGMNAHIAKPIEPKMLYATLVSQIHARSLTGN